jgi:endonuclease YncB( thermonuclease family)
MIRYKYKSDKPYGQLGFVAIAAFLALAFAFFNKGESFKGNARVIDGDSLRVETIEVRIYGIDAPEFSQTCDLDFKKVNCGRDAARHIAKLVDGKAVNCVKQDTDRYGRSVSVCKVGEIDLGRQMVIDGYAVSYGSYLREEAESRQAKRGIWAMSFEKPSDYRARMRELKGN